jgi:hypothetical protein
MSKRTLGFTSAKKRDAQAGTAERKRPSGKVARTIGAAVTARKVWELRAEGYTFREIADRAKVSRSQAQRIVADELAQLAEETKATRDQHVTLEVMRIERNQARLVPQLKKASPKAVMAWAKLEDLKAKLLGLYAPKKLEVNNRFSRMTEEELQAEIATLQAAVSAEGAGATV